jgi:uncharacterized protein YkwD
MPKLTFMSAVTRPAAWLARAALVVAVGIATASALHARSVDRLPVPASRSSIFGAETAYLAANDPSPANWAHTPPEYSPPPTAGTTGRQAQQAPAGYAPRPPALVIGSYQQVLINRDRAAAGLPPLSWSSCLGSVASANAVRLSHQGWTPPYHTNGPSLDLNCRLGHQAGENVGYWSLGINDGQLNAMFMASPEHHANIMGPYHYVATSWAIGANGAAYIAVEFS